MTLDDLGSTFWTFLRFDLKSNFDLNLTPAGDPPGQVQSMVQVWSMWGRGLNKILQWLWNDLGLPRIILNIFEIWPKVTFWPWTNLRITTTGESPGQGLYMVQVWSMWGQGLKNYCSDLEMTLDDLGSTFWTFLKFDLKLPFDLEWPWPDPLKGFTAHPESKPPSCH